MDGGAYVVGFYLVAALAVMGGMGVAFSRNIIYSALSLMVSFIGVSGLYVLCNAEFVAGIQVLVYVGGVLVLTLFAVMLTQSIAEVEVSNRSVGRYWSVLIIVGVFWVLERAYSAAEWNAATWTEAPIESTRAIGNALLGPFLLPFEVASLVLLAVLVGAVVLSRKEVRG